MNYSAVEEELARQKVEAEKKKRGRREGGVRGDTTDTRCQYTVSHRKGSQHYLSQRPEADKGWTDMFREERRRGAGNGG